MPGKTNFYYAIFKKLQHSAVPYGGNFGHMDADDSDDLAGGFSLRHPNHKYGIFGALAPIAPTFNYPIQEGWQPLNPNSLVPVENPLFVLLKASLQASPPPTVIVNGQEWPVMPLAGVVPQDWIDFNTGTHKLIDALEAWIIDGKPNDTPKKFALTYDGWMANPPKLWPGLTDHNKPGFKVTPLLYVASMSGDDGRRHGDSGMPDVPLDHVPADYWAKSQIFLTDELGHTRNPAHLKAGEEYYITALIGNSGNWAAGRAVDAQHKINVRCDAMAFNTVMSPNTPLPALSNLDPTSASAVYEPYFIDAEAWDVAGFRFNVDSVFAKLATALAQSGMDLGGATPQAWLNDSHACVKVRITSGELDNIYKPDGNAPLTLDSDPRKDRHIAQRNLAPFEVTMQGAKKLQWKTFIVSQVGTGANALVLQHGLPAESFRLYLAVTRQAFTRYVATGGRFVGFELVREGVAAPFPEAVILRQTVNDKEGATRLDVAAHDKDPFLGMALGIEWDPSRQRPSRLGEVTMIHMAGRDEVAGGFTLQLQPARQRPAMTRA